MTLSEFKAWFEGFTEGIEGAPTAKQFVKIKAKVADIDGAPVTYPIFVDRYWHRPEWVSPYLYPYTVSLDAVASAPRITGMDQMQARENARVEHLFDSHVAMRDLGRAEALN